MRFASISYGPRFAVILLLVAMAAIIAPSPLQVRAGYVNLYGGGDCSGIGASYHLTSPPKSYTSQSGCYLSYLESAGKISGTWYFVASPTVSVPAVAQIQHNWTGATGTYGAHYVCDGYYTGCSSVSYTSSGDASRFPGF
jgi:hypothetical protein